MSIKNKLRKGFITTEILIGVIIITLSILSIIIISSLSRQDAEERARQRATDLKTLRTALEDYKLFYGSYPSTGFTIAKLEKRYSKSTYPDERWNECGKPNNWIPNLTISLPHDPADNCKNRNNPYPRYEYVSDGRDYKILSYKLTTEICDREEYKELIDPTRSCDRYDASWAVYTPGARDW